MKTNDVLFHPRYSEQLHKVADLHSVDLDALADAIHVRRMEIMAEQLRKAGFGVRTGSEAAGQFRYLLVYSPDSTLPAEWATLAEARRLLDTVANLPPATAFARWRTKIEPLAVESYTEAAAVADMRRERAEAQQLYAEGKIDSEELRLTYATSRDYLTS